MVNYQKLYAMMVDAAERAVDAIEKEQYDAAREILINAELAAEENYINGENIIHIAEKI